MVEEDDFEKRAERAPESNNEYAERWENFAAENGEAQLRDGETSGEGAELTEWEMAMQQDDVPEFNEGRPWGFGPEETDDNTEAIEDDSVEQAGKILDYGLDTASRIYSLGEVLQAVQNVDETDRDALNPLGAIYDQLAKTPEAKQYLFTEMRKDLAKDSDQKEPQKMKVALGGDGEFHEHNRAMRPQHETATTAITALKRLIRALETDERFVDLRKKADVAGKGVVEVLVDDEANPTLSYWLEQVGSVPEDSDVEEVLDDIAEKLEDETDETKENEEVEDERDESEGVAGGEEE